MSGNFEPFTAVKPERGAAMITDKSLDWFPTKLKDKLHTYNGLHNVSSSVMLVMLLYTGCMSMLWIMPVVFKSIIWSLICK